MRKSLFCTGLAAALLALGLVTATWADKPAPKKVGHGGYNMPYYGLEVIAFDHCPAGDFTDSNRRMIAVQADFEDEPGGEPVDTFTRVNDIKLAAGSEFGVIDGNACDGAAKVTFETVPGTCSVTCQSGPDYGRLCETNEDCGPSMEYRVMVRMVGKPGGKIDVSTCATAPDSGVCDTSTHTCTNLESMPSCSTDDECNLVFCSTDNVVELRRTVGKNNKPKFWDYTKELLTVCLDEDGDGNCTHVPLFSTEYEDYFWNWNTEKRPHAQLRFYPL